MSSKEKPVGVPARSEVHKKIKLEAALRGVSMVDLMDEIWAIYQKNKEKE